MIDQMGGTLKMSNHCLSSAYMFYKMAANKRFTSGRKTTHVIGACLYLVSRTEKTPRIFSICTCVTLPYSSSSSLSIMYNNVKKKS